jgi:polar amino acid transport system substrate-binding protein
MWSAFGGSLAGRRTQQARSALRLCALCLLLLLLFAANGNGAIIAEVDPQYINVAANEWEDQTNADGSGLYFDLIRAVYQPMGIQVRIRTLPFKRAAMLLRNQTIDASAGFYSAETAKQIGWHFYATPKRPIDAERITAIFKKGTMQNWRYPGSLTGKRVAWISGYGYELAIKAEMEHQTINSQSQGWKLLQAGRVDVYLDSESDAIAAADASGVNLDDYQFETVVWENLYVPFAVNKKGLRLMRIFDKRMEELHNSGELAELYHRWRRDPPPWIESPPPAL